MPAIINSNYYCFRSNSMGELAQKASLQRKK